MCSHCFWPAFFICFSLAFLFSFFLCPFLLEFSLLLIRSSSVALFIHSHSLPCCHFCLFVFCAFWSFLLSELSTWWADRDTDTHGGMHRHTVCRNSFNTIDKYTLKLGTDEVHNYIHPHTEYTHTQTLSYCVALPGRELFLGWVTLYSVYFPPSVVKQQPSEAKTMATASAALTMGSWPHDITLGATHGQTDTNTHRHETMNTHPDKMCFCPKL